MKHAKFELELAGLFDKDSDYKGMIGKAVMELMKVFSKQGHSGFSAPRVASLFKQLADYKPLKSIICDDNEWGEVSDGLFQNKRCHAVFKEGKNEKPYYLDAIVWRDKEGSTWTGTAKDKNGNEIRSRQFIKLPFRPKTFYVDVIDHIIKDEKQLVEVFKYYERY